MLAPWEALNAEILRASRVLVEIMPDRTEDLQKLLAEHDAPDIAPARLEQVRRELHGRLADARRHFWAHRGRKERRSEMRAS